MMSSMTTLDMEAQSNETVYVNAASLDFFNRSSLDADVDDYEEFVVGYERYIVPAIFCFVVVTGCIGNLLVLVVVVRNREQFTNTTNLFIVNLAVADLLFLIFCVPFHAVIYIYYWPFGDAVCKLVHFAQYASMTASVYTLVAMSIDRFLAVGYPLRTKHLRTPPCALVVAVVVWVISAAFGSPWSANYSALEYSIEPSLPPIVVCADTWGLQRANAHMVLFVVDYAIPLSAIGVLSALTVRQLWATETTADGPSRRRSMLAKRRVTRLIAVVVAVFALCWMPSHVIWIWTTWFPSTWRNTYPFYYFRIAAHVLSYANSSMNPVIYAFLSSRFRIEFRRAIYCGRRRPVQFRQGGPRSISGSASGVAIADRGFNSTADYETQRFVNSRHLTVAGRRALNERAVTSYDAPTKSVRIVLSPIVLNGSTLVGEDCEVDT